MTNPLVLDLRRQINETVGPLLAGMRRVALLEFPGHANVGDSAIWRGETRYLHLCHHLRPVFTDEISSYSRDRLTAVADLDAILLHGGGNLGDVWPKYLEAKIRLLTDLPHLRVIQLPQTVHFKGPATLDSFRRAVARHKSFTLLVRGQESLEFAQQNFDCETHSCPDMAFWLDLSRGTPTHDVVCLLRTDREAKEPWQHWRPPDGESIRIVDWLDEPASWTIGLERFLTGTIAQYPRKLAFLDKSLAGLRDRAAAQRVRRGCALLSSGKVVVTDRLHGHILCVLMGIPHVLLDNSYGKLRQFFDSWTHNCSGVQFADSLEEAVILAQTLAAESRGANPQ